MALNLVTQYPGKIDNTDPNFPYGKAQNITLPGDGTGTPWEKALVNDIVGHQQALLKSAGIVPSNTADKVTASQKLQAIVEIAAGRAVNYTVSGTANAIVLTPNANQQGPASYYDGLEVIFVASGTLTSSPVTVNVNGLGVKSVTKQAGAAAIWRDFIAGNKYKLRYNGAAFQLVTDYALTSVREQVSVGTGSGSGWTGIPNSVEKILVSISDISLVGTGNLGLSIVSNVGTITTGYKAGAIQVSTGTKLTATNHYPITSSIPASAVLNGTITMMRTNVNIWTISGNLYDDVNNEVYSCAGSCVFSGPLTGLQIKANTANFDAGRYTFHYRTTK